jgi:hypothetical protein
MAESLRYYTFIHPGTMTAGISFVPVCAGSTLGVGVDPPPRQDCSTQVEVERVKKSRSRDSASHSQLRRPIGTKGQKWVVNIPYFRINNTKESDTLDGYQERNAKQCNHSASAKQFSTSLPVQWLAKEPFFFFPQRTFW